MFWLAVVVPTNRESRMSRCTSHIAAAIIAVWAGISGVRAETTASERGRLIAEKRYSVCHAIGESGGSPQPIVLPFRRMPDRFPIEMLREALTTGVVSGHDEMPMFELGLDDVRDLVGYIDAFAPPDRRYLAEPK